MKKIWVVYADLQGICNGENSTLPVNASGNSAA